MHRQRATKPITTNIVEWFANGQQDIWPFCLQMWFIVQPGENNAAYGVYKVDAIRYIFQNLSNWKIWQNSTSSKFYEVVHRLNVIFDIQIVLVLVGRVDELVKSLACSSFQIEQSFWSPASIGLITLASLDYLLHISRVQLKIAKISFTTKLYKLQGELLKLYIL